MYAKLLISSLVQHKCTFYLYQLIFSFIKYSTDFRSWLVVFSIYFTRAADLSLKLLYKFLSSPYIFSILHYLSIDIMLFRIKCNIHSASTLTLYFINALYEKYLFNYYVDLAYRPSNGDNELKWAVEVL